MKKFIAIFGGSFNPSTDAHRNVGLLIRDQIKVDEVWYLISPQNPHKLKKGMARFDDRFAMAQLNVDGYDSLIVKDIENKYARAKADGIMETADTLKLLIQDFPDHRFAWTMGADNLKSFHTWGNSDYIAENFPLIVIPRAGYTEDALKGPTASRYAKIDNPSDMRWMNGWYMLTCEENGINATDCRDELKAGQTPQCMRPAVARYALEHKVYAF